MAGIERELKLKKLPVTITGGGGPVMRKRIWSFVVSVMVVTVVTVQAVVPVPPAPKLQLPAVLSSHMVLQRDMPVPVWGAAIPGATVTVEFAGQTKTAQANEKGAWKVKLDPMSASAESRVMIISVSPADPAQAPITLEDVLVGEVWVGSGQSNMAQPVKAYTTDDRVLATNAAANYPQLRLNNAKAQWQPATPEESSNFSALMFSFGVPLQKAINVPVGLMVGAAGSSPSRLWLSKAAYQNDPGCQAAVAKALAAYDDEKEQLAYANRLSVWNQAVAVAKKEGKPPPSKALRPVGPAKPGVYDPAMGSLYERYIRPYQPYAIRGVLWDQGESGTEIVGVDQYTLMGALIRGWRQEWGQGDFPFIYVQKPSGHGINPHRPSVPHPLGPNDGRRRETYTRIMQYTNTAMVISSDLGWGLHPRDKSRYGLRAARVALGMVYGQPVEYYGPIYLSHKVEGNQVRIRFSHVGQGLTTRGGGKLQGFSVAGADKIFFWAEAVIEGDTVVASSDKVPAPVAVRYAWALDHPWANLVNKDGLPSVTFRSDTW
jgi:sialate O-acetylesterase